MSRGGSNSKVGRGGEVGKGGGDRCGSHNLFREWRRDSAIHTHKEKGWVAKGGGGGVTLLPRGGGGK